MVARPQAHGRLAPNTDAFTMKFLCLTYTNSLRATAKIISNLVKDLEKMHICPGVKPTERCCASRRSTIWWSRPLLSTWGILALILIIVYFCWRWKIYSEVVAPNISIAQVTMNLVKTCWLYLDSLTMLLHLWASFGNNRKSSSQAAKLESGITPWLFGIAYLLQPNHHPAMRSWEIATSWYCPDREH